MNFYFCRKFLLSVSIFIVWLFITGCSETVSIQKHYEKGIAFIKEGNYRGAIIEFRNVLDKDANSFEARML